MRSNLNLTVKFAVSMAVADSDCIEQSIGEDNIDDWWWKCMGESNDYRVPKKEVNGTRAGADRGLEVSRQVRGRGEYQSNERWRCASKVPGEV